MADSQIHLREATSEPRVKPAPKTNQIPTAFSYFPSDDGTDENLLILLHGLGDTHIPFSKLGRQLKLPQTAILALRAPEKIPFLYEEAYQWYTSFDQLGDLIDRPNPTPALDLLSKVFTHLIEQCEWSNHKIHLFGFAQGGSVALEFAIKFWRQQLEQSKKTSGQAMGIGSVVSISGPLLSYPTLSSPCSSPVLAVYRLPPAEPSLAPGDITALKKAFSFLKEHKLSPKGPGMPSSKDEWEPIMRFWSERLSRKPVDGLYEVMSGITTPKS
ncbi:alpha/beta-hydrolase [Marasmius fiardii PR-910]|nr:alpha/beta-hydrolase [Marasmius fiardii PR-910]